MKTDTAEEIARVMADLDSFGQLFDTGGAAPSTSAAGASSVSDWSKAVVAARQGLPDDLSQLTRRHRGRHPIPQSRERSLS